MSAPIQPPAWHPDPQDPQMLRYWDGQQWTEHRSPLNVAPPPPNVQNPAPQVGSVPAPQQERPTTTAAFVCGVIGVVVGLIPFLGVIAIPLGVIAFVLGILGWCRKPDRSRLAPASTILGGLAVALGVIGIIIVANVFNDVANEVAEIFNRDLDTSPNPPAEAIVEFGDDAKLDRLANECAGSGEEAAEACSDLWAESPVGSGYEDYANSCGARPNRDGFVCLEI